MGSFPSIFNDVLGPVMRGPSSSHSAASLRIGRIARDLMDSDITEVIVDYDPNGSLVTTHKSQGSDLGLSGGLMGWETDDSRLPDYQSEVRIAGIKIDIRYISYGAEHPNTYRLNLKGHQNEHTMTAISTGGGMIEIQEIDGVSLSLKGDYYEILIYLNRLDEGLIGWLNKGSFDEVVVAESENLSIINLKSRDCPDNDLIDELKAHQLVSSVRILNPVLTVLARNNISVPFSDVEQMIEYRKDKGKGMGLGKLGAIYESERAGVNLKEVNQRMQNLVEIMEQSISTGLTGTAYKDRILHSQSPNFEQMMDSGKLVPGDVLNRIILYVSAMMEMKSSMGVIVAAPTAGSCGALPGAVLGVSDALNKTKEERVEAMFAAGIVGVFIASGATFAAEEAGCMAECGSGASMAAAGIVSLAGGNFEKQMSAASMALQNSLGMTCDTLANRVEAPCLGRNVTAASNALSSANMALADYDHLVPLDQVIEAMKQVGELMPRELCCTGLGGLAITPASKMLEKQLEEMNKLTPSMEDEAKV
ncbi:MAG TPA: serine dehydratase [Verrucomicrobia bacterium]|nr:serine dehydratase [Verrucomicrobiales bacterium]HIL56245.1 serine dehydratase [Verrucomicrobiota bacterium]